MSQAPKSPPIGVVSILGTQKQGCTSYFLQHFLEELKEHRQCDIKHFSLPKDCPTFCTGCAACFTRGMLACPHSQQVQPLWEAICEADLVVLAQPTYVFGPPAQVKAMLDHLGCRWLVHSPDPRMLDKRVVILSQAVGAGMRKSLKAVKTSWRYLGAARIWQYAFSVGNTLPEHIPAAKRAAIERKLDKLALSVAQSQRPHKPSLFTRLMFPMMRLGHSKISQMERKQGRPDTYDYLSWKEQGWLDKRWPWRQA